MAGEVSLEQAVPGSGFSHCIEHPLPPSAGFCALVHDFLSAAECTALITRMEAFVFRAANSDYPPTYRDNDRLVCDDAALAQQLFQRLGTHVPQQRKLEDSTWHLQELNPRLRACRYRAGQQFRIHQDGVYHVSARRRSLLTFMIYLDGPESFDGGDTVFYAGGPRAQECVQPAEIGRLTPRRGSLIVFDHALWHAGAVVTRGCKHVLRSDLVYERCDNDVAVTSMDSLSPAVPVAARVSGSEPAEKLAAHVSDAPFTPGHQGYVWTLQPLADGRIASGGRDRAIRLWSGQGACTGVLQGHGQSVLGLAVNCSGVLASVSRDRDLRLWDTNTVQCLRRVEAHAAAALCVTVVGNDRFASGGADGAIALWRDDGAALARWSAEQGWVWALAPLDEERLLSVSEDGGLRCWSLHDGRAELLWRGEHALRALVVGGEGDARWIAVGDEQGLVHRWRVADGWRNVHSFRAHDAAVRRLRVLPDGRLASAGEDGRLRVWRSAAVEFEAAHDNFVTDVEAWNQGLLSCGYDGVLRQHSLPATGT